MTIMVIVAIVLLVLHWGGRNAVWGGATLGVIVGFIISLITEDWNPLAISFVVGTFAGTIFEWVGKSAVALKHKKGTTFDNLEYNYSFSYSSSWSVEDLGSGLLVSASAPSELAGFHVYVSDHDKSPENQVSSHLKQAKRAIKFTLLSKPRSFNFQGHPACEVKYSVKGKAGEHTSTEICVTRGGYMYTIELWVEHGGDQYKEELDVIYRSFKFTK